MEAEPGRLRVILPPVPVVPLAERAKALTAAGVETMLEAEILIVPPFPLASATTDMPVRGLVKTPPAVTIKLFRTPLLKADRGFVEASPTVTALLAERLRAAPLPAVRLPLPPVITRLPAAFPIVRLLAADTVPPVVFNVGVWMLTVLSVVVLPIAPALVTVAAVNDIDGASIFAPPLF